MTAPALPEGHWVERWVAIGERVSSGGKLAYFYLRPNGEKFGLTKPLRQAKAVGATFDVTMKTEGDVEYIVTGAPHAPRFVEFLDAKRDDRVGVWLGQQEEARQQIRVARVLKKGAPDLGDMTLRQVREQIEKTFGQSRADWIASVVAYLYGAIK